MGKLEPDRKMSSVATVSYTVAVNKSEGELLSAVALKKDDKATFNSC